MKTRQNMRENVQDNPEVIDAKFEEVEAPAKKENFLQKAGKKATEIGDKIDARKRERALKKAGKESKPKRKKIIKGIAITAAVAGAAAGAAFVGSHLLSKAADTIDLGLEELPDGEDELEPVEDEDVYDEDEESEEGETATEE